MFSGLAVGPNVGPGVGDIHFELIDAIGCHAVTGPVGLDRKTFQQIDKKEGDSPSNHCGNHHPADYCEPFPTKQPRFYLGDVQRLQYLELTVGKTEALLIW